MNRRRPWHAAAALLAWGLAAAAPARAAGGLPPLPPRVPDGLGINIHFLDPQPGEMEMLVTTGVRWVRMDLDWSATERQQGHYDFSAFRRLLDRCDHHGLRVMTVMAYSNPLYDHGQSPSSDAAVAAFARWFVAAAKTFQGRGVMWELYNEPNNVFWRPAPDVNAYIKLALATGRAMRAELPDELFVGPALSGTDGAWLEPCYKAGLLTYWDAVTVHPYGNDPPEGRARHYQGVKALIARYAPKGSKPVPVISGEWGYTAASMPEETQGKLLARMWLFNLSQGIPLSIWYDWRDDGPDPANAEHRFGMVANTYHPGGQPVLEPKPAYWAARTLTERLAGFAFASRAANVGTKDDYVLTFQRGQEIRLAAWTTAPAAGPPHHVNVPAPAGSTWTLTSFRGTPLGTRRADANGVTIDLTDAPVYLAPAPAAAAPG